MGTLSRASDADPVRYSIESKRTWAWARVALIAELGARGRIDREAAPGYAVGLKALEAFLDRTDPKPKVAEDDGGGRRIVNVAIIVEAQPHAAIQANGGGVRLVLGDGDNGRGDGGA